MGASPQQCSLDVGRAGGASAHTRVLCRRAHAIATAACRAAPASALHGEMGLEFPSAMCGHSIISLDTDTPPAAFSKVCNTHYKMKQ